MGAGLPPDRAFGGGNKVCASVYEHCEFMGRHTSRSGGAVYLYWLRALVLVCAKAAVCKGPAHEREGGGDLADAPAAFLQGGVSR